MKICLISNDFYPNFPCINGGIENSVENLANGLYKSGANFFVVTPQNRIEKSYPYEIFYTKTNATSISKLTNDSYINEVKEILKEQKPDIIWSQSHWSILPLLELHIPIICTFHDGVIDRQQSWLTYSSYVNYRFVSEFQFNRWVTEDWQKSKSKMIYLSVNQDDIDQHNYIRQDYFLWVGSLAWGLENKGLDDLIQLSYLNPDKRFIAFGSGNDKLRDHLNHLKNTNFVFMGSLKNEDKPYVFGSAIAFLQLSKLEESFGMTVAESLSFGTPVLGRKIGATPELVDNFHGTYNCLDQINKALNDTFDYEAARIYSKKFNTQNEIKSMIEWSKDILNESK